jgi:prepilin-type N-terminal cleavage/methylation domain-containing protein
MTRNKAFTLIELLVVIAIIAILAAILFPVFAQAKAAAKKSATLSNLKQNGTAVQIYLSDADDTYPQSAYCTQMPDGTGTTPNGYLVPGSGCRVISMYDAILPYTKNRDIFTDTAEPKAIPWAAILGSLGVRPNTADLTNPLFNGSQFISFAGMVPNFAVFEDPAVAPNFNEATRSATSFEAPADTIEFATGKNVAGATNVDLDPATALGASNTAGVQAQIVTNYRTPAPGFNAQRFPGVARHSESIIASFSDSHAKAFKRNARFPGLTAPDPNISGANSIVPVYNFPFDINGIPGILAEPAP